MIIREMFQKPIERDIKGVIKVGQGEEENIRQELDEYVVTRELTRHFTDFFVSYKKGITGHTDKMGVWISGFFGSGKSHLLKILSYLLENREVGGKYALDYFDDDKKIADPMVLADMKLCADMAPHTDVVLFNVDSKSEQTGKQSKDAIVSVFLKVFNEMRGFCGSIPHLADLERNLEDTGRYEEFKRLFREECGKEWQAARHNFDFMQDSIVEVLVGMGYMSEAAARNWCEKAISDYDISIEAFAKLVADYIAKKGSNHHVVFLADEIGQYIGEDSRLMLNLQTVTEDLGTACNGKAWVVVTSQQDIDSIAKDMGLRSNDFSKIQGRFDTRLTLSSANVDEVIKKRILAKTDTAGQTLRLLYEQKETIIKNLIVFNDSVEKKLYSGETDFTEVYPFVPYQFNLLASVLTSIRQHGASGKHLSEGERSMLALFKESAVKLMEQAVGAIIPFNVFYDALHRFLDHSHAGVVIRALENEIINPDKVDSCFAVEVLKALFMVKYVSEVDTNADNLVSLLVDGLDADRIALKTKVDEALRVLTGQKLVQRNGDIYVFLTDEEQEINREIDGQNIEMAEVTAEISKLIFEDIYGDKRYKYPAHSGRYTFQFNQFVDEHPHHGNQSYDVGVRVLTPNSEYRNEESTLRMMSGQNKEVLVVLPDDRAFFNELRDSMKIEKYLKASSGGALTKYEQIKIAKGEEMRKRAQDAKMFLQEAIRNAEVYVNGDKLQIGMKDITVKINDALRRLVETVYHKLPYIEVAFDEANIRKLFEKSSGQQSVFLKDGKPVNGNALNDMLDFIAMNTQVHTKTSIKTLHDRFRKAPYGFVENDVEWLAAKLFVDGDIAFTVGGAAVTLLNKTTEEIIRYVTKRDFVEKLLIERREKANEHQKKTVREVMKELFGTVGADDDDGIMQAFKKGCSDHGRMIEKYELVGQNKPYPGKKVMNTGKSLLRNISQIEYSTEFFRVVSGQADALLNFAEDFEPVKAFFAGEQKKIFDNALDKMRIYDESKTFIVDEDVERCVAEIKEILQMPLPYASIPRLPGLINQFVTSYGSVLNGMSGPIYEAIEDAKKRVFKELNQKRYKEEFSSCFYKLFGDLKEKADCCNNVAMLQNIRVEADALKMRLLSEIAKKDAAIAAMKPPTMKLPQVGGDGDTASPTAQPKSPKVKHVSIKSVNTAGTWQVKSTDDIDKRIDELRQRLYSEMEDGAVLNIEF